MHFLKVRKNIIQIIFSFILVLILGIFNSPTEMFYPQIYQTAYVYDEDQLIGVTQENDNQEINSQNNMDLNTTDDIMYNTTVNQTGSLLNYNTTDQSNQEVEKYVEENTYELNEGYQITIDGKEKVYIKNKEDLEWVQEQVLKTIIPDNTKAEYFIDTGDFQSYTQNGREYKDMKLENNITVEETYVPGSKIIDNKEDLLFYVLHGDQEKKYATITENQSLDQIQKKNKINDLELSLNNPDVDNQTILYLGQEIIVNQLDPIVDLSVYYEEEKKETVKYRKEVKKTDDLDIGDTEVIQKGKNGSELVTYTTKQTNGVNQYTEKSNSEVIEQSINKITLEGTYEVPGVGTGDFAWPGSSTSITCDFYCYSGHGGVDIQSWYGAPIYAADNGVVKTAGWGGAYGNHVVVDHQNGYETLYAHMASTPPVSVGESVEQGQVIGYEGATGNVTGEHVHFEVHQNGVQQDPLNYI